MALFSKKNLDNKSNKYGITEDDMIGDLTGFPVGVVVRMMEEQEKQGNEPDVTVFQDEITCIVDSFDWAESMDGWEFWNKVINNIDFDVFFDKYPEYMMY